MIHHPLSDAHLVGIHYSIGVKRFLQALKHNHRRTILLFHQPAQFYAYTVVVVDHAAIFHFDGYNWILHKYRLRGGFIICFI